MINIDERCTGCGACYNACPKKCISMKPNNEGFLYPEINIDECIKCRKCTNVCPIEKKVEKKSFEIKVFAALTKNYDILLKSSSGGIFTVIANLIIENNGVVFGSIFDKDMQVEHIGINNKEQLKLLQGSKYVQSNTKNTFKDVEKFLKEGTKVLYSGTPCQIDGLKKYLRKEYENLITIDLICHGVPSQLFFDKYINYLEIKNKSKIDEIKFRNKKSNTASLYPYMLTYKTNSKKISIKNPYLDPFYYAFHKGMNLRESCYKCKYTNLNRVGDITLGDYWGVKEFHPNIENINGVSLMLINSSKGEKVFNKIKNEIIYEKSKLEFVACKNKCLSKPSERSIIRNYIYKELNQKGFKGIIKRYLRPKKYIILKFKRFIKDRNNKERFFY